MSPGLRCRRVRKPCKSDSLRLPDTQPFAASCSNVLTWPGNPHFAAGRDGWRGGSAAGRGNRVEHRPGESLEVETQLEPVAPDSPESRRMRLPSWATVAEAAVFVVCSVFFILYGVVPLLGGDGLGLVGAD